MKKFLLFGFLFVLFTQTAFAATQSAAECPKISTELPANVDMEKVRSEWLSWYNTARGQNGLPSYVYDESLNVTASNWSFYAKKRGFIDHKRAGQSGYYDYKKVGQWFAGKGISFVRGSGRSDYVENIGWDYYSCSATDCTDELLASIRHTYNFFMGEKGKKYRAHYDSIMNKHYTKIGMGIAVDPVKKRYYLTVHYGTDVVVKPEFAACNSAPSAHKF